MLNCIANIGLWDTSPNEAYIINKTYSSPAEYPRNLQYTPVGSLTAKNYNERYFTRARAVKNYSAIISTSAHDIQWSFSQFSEFTFGE